MNTSPLGRTLVIANPAAHSGKGARGIEFTRRFFDAYEGVTSEHELLVTRAAGDAVGMAAGAAGFDTVVALGGDGIIHEVVNGLMELPRDARPALGIIPFGSGNDFARTLGIAANNAEASLAQLVRGARRTIELGRVTSDATDDGGLPLVSHFMETLSFGLDAAIAIDTTNKRSDGTQEEGSQLYLTSGLKILSKASAGYPCTFSLDGGEPISVRALILAIQNGPTYGGGFRICPASVPNDGLLDVCFNVKNPSLPRVMALFGMARFGLHVRSNAIRAERAHTVDVAFDEEVPPCQVDGEEFFGSHFHVEVLPDALDVIVPRDCPW